jgi:hypothetical protein
MRTISPDDPAVRRDLARAIRARRSAASHRAPGSEESTQAAIIEELARRGYLVLSTSEHRKREQCAGCGAWRTPGKGRGTTPGVPDLLVSRDEWPPGVWLGLEVKGARTAVSREQKALAARRRIFIVRSAREAMEAVQEAKRPR